jgi:hypothetical protein
MDTEMGELAKAAAKVLVSAVTTDAWAMAKSSFSRLFGRGVPEATESAVRRLDHTSQELASLTGEELATAMHEQEVRWQGRLADLLEDYPALVTELRALLTEINPRLPPSAQAGSGGLAAGGDIHIWASGGSQAAGIVHGGIGMPSPRQPGTAQT